jgi:pseudomonalisin
MRHLRPTLFASIALLSLLPCAFAQSPAPRSRIGVPMIHGPIVDSDAVTLEGNTHPLARAEYDRGEVAADTRMERMVLVLQPGSQKQSELNELTEAQQNPESPLYHQWLTPEDYGSRFGASAADLARIAAWLQSHGFTVEPPSAGRQIVIFSGSAAQVEDTFHTQMHRYDINGQMHMANSQDPQIPRALAQVVSGVLSLHDFRRDSAIRTVRQVAKPENARPENARPENARPDNTEGSTHYIFPADFATIYDLNPQYTAGKTGTGASIAIVGRSNINLSDVSSFRSTSGLPANQPTVILEGANPGLVSGDQDESTLDVEWSGAVAPGATVNFVVAASTATSDGVDLSAQYIVNHKTATVMSTSYGNCESNMGSAEMVFYNSLWQQAASEGISSFVSSGDSGAAGCNGGSSSTGSGAGVNGLCSSPYSTCVGGTEFNEGSANYWSATNGTGGGSALAYIPEKVWNESASDGGSGLWSSGGGISKTYTQPTWQAGVSGAGSNGMRAVPDVALTAASHDGYLICEDGNWYVIAGTSAASPSFAGIVSVVNQKLGGTGQGNANPTLYSMLSAANKPFHSTPAGNNSVPGVNGFTASGASFNLATGLGSVDANLLVNEWPASGTVAPAQGITLKPSATTLSVVEGKTATFTVAVTGSNGFTGTASLSASAPSGVTVAFSPASVKAGASATATVTVSSAAAVGTANITITATSGTIASTATVALTVSAGPSLMISTASTAMTVVQGKTATLAVTAMTAGSFTGTVTMSVTGLPSGVTATWSAASFTATGSTSKALTLTLKAITTAALATGTLKITATGESLTSSTNCTVQVTAAPAVTVALSATTVSMKSTASATVLATVTEVGGVTPAASLTGVTFSVTGMPTGISVSWGAPSLNASGKPQATLTINGSSSAVTTSTKLTVTAAVVDANTQIKYAATQQATLAVTR